MNTSLIIAAFISGYCIGVFAVFRFWIYRDGSPNKAL